MCITKYADYRVGQKGLTVHQHSNVILTKIVQIYL